MTTIGILGAGQAGSTFARVAVAVGYDIVIANTRGPHTLQELVNDLGPHARAADIVETADAADAAFLAFPYSPNHMLPAAELAGKVVMDNNNYMIWRDGNLSEIGSGQATVQELRQRQLPSSKVVKAFSNIQFHGRLPLRVPSDNIPALIRLARPEGARDRRALVASSDYPDAVAFVADLYDKFGFDTVDNSPLSESWRSAPGTPMWAASFEGQSRDELLRNLQLSVPPRKTDVWGETEKHHGGQDETSPSN